MTAQDWPYDSPNLLAWGAEQSLAATAIPLEAPTLAAKKMSRTQYLAALADRVAWMVSRERDPPAAVLWLEAEMQRYSLPVANQDPEEGAEENARALIEEAGGVLLDQIAMATDWHPRNPIAVRRLPEAVAAIKETRLRQWWEMAMPALEDLT